MRSSPQSAPPNFGALSATAANTTESSSEGTPNSSTKSPVGSDAWLATGQPKRAPSSRGRCFMAASVSGTARLFRRRRQLGEQLAQQVELDGLHQVAVEAVSLGADAVAIEAPAGDRDQRDAPPVRVLAHALGDLVAVHARHREVEQDDRRLELVQRFQGGGAVV